MGTMVDTLQIHEVQTKNLPESVYYFADRTNSPFELSPLGVA